MQCVADFRARESRKYAHNFERMGEGGDKEEERGLNNMRAHPKIPPDNIYSLDVLLQSSEG